MASPLTPRTPATPTGGRDRPAVFVSDAYDPRFSAYTHVCIIAASAPEHKEGSLQLLKEEVMATLDKEVKSLDEDSWMFAGPRSEIHLFSRPGRLPLKLPNSGKK